MPVTKNAFGLSRKIPSNIKREVRQRDNFGCILCAFPIVQYEHVDPLFCVAKEHKAAGITLLCPTCHVKVTNKLISKSLIKEAMQNPKAKLLEKVSDALIFTKSHPTVKVGGATFTRCNIPLRYQDQNIISISKDSDHFFLNGMFWDSKGNQTLTIVDNEWIVNPRVVWDLEVIGNTVTIREKERKPSLIFTMHENNIFIINKIDMKIGEYKILGNENTLEVNTNIFFGINSTDSNVGFSFG